MFTKQDYARLILDIKSVAPLTQSPVVVFGGSYGGSLAAYMRMTYPEIVDIALAASAPILLYEGVTSSNAFFDVVRRDFAAINPACVDVLQAALLVVAQCNESFVQSTMQLCAATSATTVQLWARNALVSLAQLDYPTPSSGMPAWPLTVACNALLAEASTARADARQLLRALAVAVGVNYNTTQLMCFDVASEFAPCSDAFGCGG